MGATVGSRRTPGLPRTVIVVALAANRGSSQRGGVSICLKWIRIGPLYSSVTVKDEGGFGPAWTVVLSCSPPPGMYVGAGTLNGASARASSSETSRPGAGRSRIPLGFPEGGTEAPGPLEHEAAATSRQLAPKRRRTILDIDLQSPRARRDWIWVRNTVMHGSGVGGYEVPVVCLLLACLVSMNGLRPGVLGFGFGSPLENGATPRESPSRSWSWSLSTKPIDILAGSQGNRSPEDRPPLEGLGEPVRRPVDGVIDDTKVFHTKALPVHCRTGSHGDNDGRPGLQPIARHWMTDEIAWRQRPTHRDEELSAILAGIHQSETSDFYAPINSSNSDCLDYYGSGTRETNPKAAEDVVTRVASSSGIDHGIRAKEVINNQQRACAFAPILPS